MELNIKAFSLTCAIFWGVSMFLLTWWMMITENGYGAMTLFERVYLGYSISGTGSLIGLCWGFFDGLIGGAIFAWLLNTMHSYFKTEAS